MLNALRIEFHLQWWCSVVIRLQAKWPTDRRFVNRVDVSWSTARYSPQMGLFQTVDPTLFQVNVVRNSCFGRKERNSLLQLSHAFYSSYLIHLDVTTYTNCHCARRVVLAQCFTAVFAACTGFRKQLRIFPLIIIIFSHVLFLSVVGRFAGVCWAVVFRLIGMILFEAVAFLWEMEL